MKPPPFGAAAFLSSNVDLQPSFTVYGSYQTRNAAVADGVTDQTTGPQNHGHGQIRGVEAQATYFYDFLPGWLSGFGTDVNFTILETHGTQNTSASVYDSSQISSSKLKLPLEQLSRYSYNATLMYAKYGIDARLAYNWRSRYLMSASASNVVAPAYVEDYGQLDGSVMYTLNKNFKIGVQAQAYLARAARHVLNLG